jgi:cytochrome c-type biogenesis protein CcmH/NrfG
VKRSGDGNDRIDSRERRRCRGDRAMSARDGADESVPVWWILTFVVLALATLAGVLLALGGL